MAALPLARQELITMGSISGVRPTATESANKNAEPQFPLVSPQAIKTTGMRTAINRISTQAMELAPWSNPFLRQTEVTVKPP